MVRIRRRRSAALGEPGFPYRFAETAEEIAISEPISQILSACLAACGAFIFLAPLAERARGCDRRREPAARNGCDLPGTYLVGHRVPYLALHRVGFLVPPASPHGAVGSYPTFSPSLPGRTNVRFALGRGAVCFL